MKYQEKLIKFIQLKNELIKKETKLYYIDDYDIDTVKGWFEKSCKNIYKILKDNIKYIGSNGLTELTCIWCIHNKEDTCYKCEYGFHHGICSHEGSLYDKIITARKLFTSQVYMDMIKKIESA